MVNNYKYRNLVFEGGGVKGIAYGGALEAMDEIGVLKDIKRVAGTSAGAITAALLCLNYSAKEIGEIISKTDFGKFEDNTFFIIRDMIRLFNKYGWNKGESFKKWIGDLVENKTGKREYTFMDLHNDTVPYGYKDLYVICSNITKQRADVLSYETTPNLSIKDAIRMSMGIPIYFASIKNSDGDTIVDGGVTLNYPLTLFDYEKYLDNNLNGIKVDYNSEDEYAFNYETLGFRVDSKEEMNYLNPKWIGDKNLTKNLKNYIGALISFMMETVNRRHLHKNDWNRTVFIDSLEIKTTDFKLKSDKINSLIESGKESVKNYFEWKKNDTTEWNKKPI
jgi:NTE family protein